jgi:nicotinamide-nucleotide amidase
VDKLVSLLKDKNLTLSCAESLTGGLFASSITNISGASNVFKGGVVSYTNEIKEKVLGVNKSVLDKGIYTLFTQIKLVLIINFNLCKISYRW